MSTSETPATPIELLQAVASRLVECAKEAGVGRDEFARGQARAYAETATFIRSLVREWTARCTPQPAEQASPPREADPTP